MGVTIELQNLGDARLCHDITACVEHAFTDKRGEWRMSIAGSRASENWEKRIEGPNGFERTYTLSRNAGEHEPEAIRRLIYQLVPPPYFLMMGRVVRQLAKAQSAYQKNV